MYTYIHLIKILSVSTMDSCSITTMKFNKKKQQQLHPIANATANIEHK